MKIVNKKLKLDETKVPHALQNFGNTSNACIPLLIVTQIRDVLMQEKLSLRLSVIGVGFTRGAFS